MRRRMVVPKTQKKYLIALEETRSIIALISGTIVFVFTLGAVFYMLNTTPDDEENALHYFTVLSNLLAATGAAFMIPYAVEGIRKKRFVLPRWVVLFQYSGATCVAVTMFSSLVLILPTQGMKSMAGPNFWLHVVTPACTVILFLCVETGIAIKCKEIIIPMIPYCAYSAVYTVMVVAIGKDRGGWSDFYMTQTFWPAWISFLLMMGIGFTVAAIMRIIHNKHAKMSWKRISGMWSSDLEPSELLVEAFGLGRYIGAHCSREELTVPLDIFYLMSEKYDVPVDKLTRAYVKGALDAIGERK